MAKTTPYRLDAGARERLAKELQDEAQRVKEACLRVTRIDPDSDPGRFEALVSHMLDALDRQTERDANPQCAHGAAEQADLFDGIELEREALNELIVQLRCLSSGDVWSSDRYLVLSNYVNGQRQRERDTPPRHARQASIDWEDLGARMDAMRKRLYGEAPDGSGRVDAGHAASARPRR